MFLLFFLFFFFKAFPRPARLVLLGATMWVSRGISRRRRVLVNLLVLVAIHWALFLAVTLAVLLGVLGQVHWLVPGLKP